MNKIISLFCILAFAVPALAKKSCDELKIEIDAKFKAKGVIAYTLTVTNNADVKDEKVVGSCNGGTQKITYTRQK